ncbi:MAG: hypothetical protein EA390_06785 [Balneolaceae bacterium]|nr:MAG: hypothetical protein EA390_06785 [Balneolaceae bacterium]
MKSIPLSLFSLLFILSVQTGSAQQTQTLFNGEVSHGGFGGPVLKFSDVAGELGVWIGGRGGWIINFDENHAISLGGGGHALVTEHLVPDQQYGDSERDHFAMNAYGGFIIEYTNRSYQLVHLTASSLIGAGGLMIRDRDFDNVDHTPDSFFVFEPGANLELNVTDFFRVAAGLSYRLTSGISRAGFTDNDFSGINGTITLKFGRFI